MNTTLEIIPAIEILDPTGSPLATYQADVKIMPMAELWRNFMLAAGKRSQKTAKSYESALVLFLDFIGQKYGVDIIKPLEKRWRSEKNNREYTRIVWEVYGDTEILSNVDLALLDLFSHWLLSKGNGQATISNRLSGVNAFLSVALRDKVISRDQGIDLQITPYKAKQKKQQQQTGRRLDPQEVRTLRATVELKARNDTKMIRDRAIIDFMLFAGLRRQEVADLDIANFKMDGGRWWMSVTGKGDKVRRLKVHDVLFKSLTAWLEITGAELGTGSGYLFQNLTKAGSLTNNKLDASAIGRLVAEYGHAAGLAKEKGPNRLSPHDLRRTAARNAYELKATIYQVQTMLGHASPDTTQLYIGALEDDSNTAIDKIAY